MAKLRGREAKIYKGSIDDVPLSRELVFKVIQFFDELWFMGFRG